MLADNFKRHISHYVFLFSIFSFTKDTWIRNGFVHLGVMNIIAHHVWSTGLNWQSWFQVQLLWWLIFRVLKFTSLWTEACLLSYRVLILTFNVFAPWYAWVLSFEFGKCKICLDFPALNVAFIREFPKKDPAIWALRGGHRLTNPIFAKTSSRFASWQPTAMKCSG